MFLQMGQLKLGVREIVDGPPGMGRKAEQAARGEARWGGEPCSEIPLPVTTGDCVHREGHDIKLRSLRPLQNTVIQAAVFVKIELEHGGRINHARNFFDTHGAE